MNKTFFWLMVLVTLLLPKNVRAYRFTSDFNNGFYFQNFPVGMQIFVDSNSEGQLLAQLVSQAVSQWEDVVGRKIFDIPSSYLVSGHFGNNIRWANNFAAETGFDPGSTLAVTTRRTSGTYIGQVEVVLNAEFPGMTSNSGQILYRTILHELGHVIMLDHSEVSQAVMASSLTTATSPRSDDVLGANAVVDEALYRQSIGFTSELAPSGDKSSSPVACGSVDFSGSGGDGGGPFNSVFNLLLGFMVIAFIRKTSARQKFPDEIA